MGSFDNALRIQAVPFYGQVLGYNHSENSEQDISSTYSDPAGLAPGSNAALLGIGDLQDLAGHTAKTDYLIRILRPNYAQITQAYLNISLTFAATETSPAFYVSCGSGFASDKRTPTQPTSGYISQAHLMITGKTTALTGVAGQPITAYKLNIQPLIPQYGSANYSPDFFVVGIHFLQAPVQTGLYHLTKFFITGSALVTP